MGPDADVGSPRERLDQIVRTLGTFYSPVLSPRTKKNIHVCVPPLWFFWHGFQSDFGGALDSCDVTAVLGCFAWSWMWLQKDGPASPNTAEQHQCFHKTSLPQDV